MDKIAVIYGTNNYYNIPNANLKGCVNDAAKWKEIAETKGFDVNYMTNPADNTFKSATSAAIANCDPGDVLLIAGSSHGSFRTDTSGDEVDRKDEIICFSNFSASGGYVSDDQMRSMLSALKPGVVCDVFLDNCYAGSGTRLMPQKHKIPIMAGKYIPFPGKARKLPQKAIITNMKESLFAACGEGQTSLEVSVGGIPRGLFSFYAQKALQLYPAYTRDQIMNYVKPRVAAVVPGQTPQLECQAANAAKLPFA